MSLIPSTRDCCWWQVAYMYEDCVFRVNYLLTSHAIHRISSCLVSTTSILNWFNVLSLTSTCTCWTQQHPYNTPYNFPHALGVHPYLLDPGPIPIPLLYVLGVCPYLLKPDVPTSLNLQESGLTLVMLHHPLSSTLHNTRQVPAKEQLYGLS